LCGLEQAGNRTNRGCLSLRASVCLRSPFSPNRQHNEYNTTSPRILTLLPCVHRSWQNELAVELPRLRGKHVDVLRVGALKHESAVDAAHAHFWHCEPARSQRHQRVRQQHSPLGGILQRTQQNELQDSIRFLLVIVMMSCHPPTNLPINRYLNENCCWKGGNTHQGLRNAKISNKSSFGSIDTGSSCANDRMIVTVVTTCLIDFGAHECW